MEEKNDNLSPDWLAPERVEAIIKAGDRVADIEVSEADQWIRRIALTIRLVSGQDGDSSVDVYIKSGSQYFIICQKSRFFSGTYIDMTKKLLDDAETSMEDLAEVPERDPLRGGS